MPVRRASVNSFGYGGANAHCILEHVNSIVPGYQLGGQKQGSSATNGLHDAPANSPTDITNDHTVARETACYRTNGLKGYANGTTIPNAHSQSRDLVQVVASSTPGTRRLVLLPLSGHDRHSLKANLSAIAGIVGDYHLADLTYTLSSRRSRYIHRGYALVNADTPEITLDVDSVTCGKSPGSQIQRVGFVFTGICCSRHRQRILVS